MQTTMEVNEAKPKIRGDRHRGIALQPRFLPTDKQLVERAAAAEGLPTTTWIRMVSVRAARKVLRKSA